MGKNFLLNIISMMAVMFAACDKKGVDVSSSDELEFQYQEFTNEIVSESSLAIVTLQRTACFGFCPIYTVGIFKDGKVIYFGLANVETTGLHFSEISSNSVDSLLSYATKNGYFDLQSGYYSKMDTTKDGQIYEVFVTDLPTKITSLKVNGNRKIVENYFGGPAWLSKFEGKIDSLANIKKWTGK